MGWLKPLLELFSAVAQWFQQKQLFDAGGANQRAKDLEAQDEIRRKQQQAAKDAPSSRSELIDKLRNPADKGKY